MTHYPLTRQLNPGFPFRLSVTRDYKRSVALLALGLGGQETLLQVTSALQGGKKNGHV
jgi:hypothetical protein